MKSSHFVHSLCAPGISSCFVKGVAMSALLVTTVLSLTNCASTSKRSDDQPRAEAASPAPIQTPQQQAAARLQGEKDHFIVDTQKRIDEMFSYENNLRAKAAQDSSPRNKKMQNAADDLATLLKGANSSLDEVKSASAENWVDYRRDVDQHMERASSMYSNSQSLFQ